jgi:hypothetical protein
MKRRRAASLLELMLIMSACTVLLTSTGVLLHRAMRIQMQSRSLVRAEASATRLAEQFRGDAHAARTVVTQNDRNDTNTFLRMDVGPRTVEYSHVAGAVRRLESGGGRPTWREDFTFPATSKLTIEQVNTPQRLVLTIIAKPPDPFSPEQKPSASTNIVPVAMRVEAVVGADLHLVAAPVASETRK